MLNLLFYFTSERAEMVEPSSISCGDEGSLLAPILDFCVAHRLSSTCVLFCGLIAFTLPANSSRFALSMGVSPSSTVKFSAGVLCLLDKPVKAAIIVFGDKVEVLHDPQLVTETESAVLLKIGRMKLGIISIYFEGDEDIEPYIIRTKKACKNLGTENLIIAGDINAWSHWWEAREKTGGAYRDFLDEMGFHILNTGSTPTFETYRAIESAVV
ncbi:hypothetical protein EVAR_77673_1 [Eumeta japonica]|uniref:Endonuclease/exonuclease/phosphatase domain-containing protein n=1 Tax=Eumeta variegata TaxID=151549 RepID=A0A4C2A9F9_EUMVA|nr:hypothetical protein EVAR_77673_1 [Eumeta japonica]